jgi:heme oxygenase
MNLRDQLKAATSASHQQLENQLDLLRENFQRENLVALLEGFYGYYAPCEDDLANAPRELASLLNERRKVPLLAADLRFLGHDEESLAALPLCPIASASTAHQVLGRWYVLEGATLGGQFVARHLRQKFGLQDRGCAFFHSYGEEVGTRWKEFCGLLERSVLPEHHDHAVEAANDTFRSLGAWLRDRTAAPKSL